MAEETWHVVLEEGGAAGGGATGGGQADGSVVEKKAAKAQEETVAEQKRQQPMWANVAKFVGGLVSIVGVIAFVFQMIRRSKIFSTFMDSFLMVLSAFIDIMMIPLIPVFSWVLRKLVSLLPYAETIGGKIADFIKDPWKGIKAAFDWLLDLPSTIAQHLADFFNSMGLSGLGDMFSKVSIDMADAASKIKTDLSDAATQIQTIWGDPNSSLWTKISSTASVIWDTIKKIAVDIWPDVKSAASTIWETVSSFVKEKATDFYNNTLIPLWNDTIWPAIHTKADEIWDKICDYAKKVWDEIKPYVIGVFVALATGAVLTLAGNFITVGAALAGMGGTLEVVGTGLAGLGVALGTAALAIGVFVGALALIRALNPEKFDAGTQAVSSGYQHGGVGGVLSVIAAGVTGNTEAMGNATGLNDVSNANAAEQSDWLAKTAVNTTVVEFAKLGANVDYGVNHMFKKIAATISTQDQANSSLIELTKLKISGKLSALEVNAIQRKRMGQEYDSFYVPQGYKFGTSFVPEDMLAFLHRGERVVPANENKSNYNNKTVNATFNMGAVGESPFWGINTKNNLEKALQDAKLRI